MSDKKARERLFLNEVVTLYPDFPFGSIINTERPDFLIMNNSQVIGIEVVDYIRGQNSGESVYRRNEILWQKVADTARAEFEAIHSDPSNSHFRD